MSNFGTDVKKVGEEVLHVIEAPIEFCVKAEKVIETVVKEDPQAKTILATVVSKAEAIGALGAKDLLEKGLNPIDDLATLQAVQDLAAYVKSTVVPFIEQAYGEVVTDLSAAA